MRQNPISIMLPLIASLICFLFDKSLPVIFLVLFLLILTGFNLGEDTYD
jgi:multisubunit Na+/H+ antiporter MnhG subunit